MGRPQRAAEGGYVYHVLNRANARMTIFKEDADYDAFENVLIEAVTRTQTRLLAYCVMRNHWHLVVWPRENGELSQFVGWLTLTHTQRWHAFRQSTGSGHVYQGRFKSFPIQDDDHLFTVARYAERNAQRANLVRRAEQWRWGSLYRWLRGSAEDRRLLAAWPMPRPPNWLEHVNAPQTEAELAALRRCVNRGSPFGTELWCNRTVRSLGLESTIRPRGRPIKQINGS
jgi:putative transposase